MACTVACEKGYRFVDIDKGYATLAAASFDSLDEVLSQRCSSSVQISGNYTVQILPTVLQNVFYDLCGLTLRTIFDLRIPGATTPIRSLLALSGESIPSQGIGCPQLTASNNAISDFTVPCPVGSVNVNNTCVRCPLGSYQDEPGQLACKACPEGTYTQYDGALSRKSCLTVCGNGMYSATGLVPCQLCPRHTFSGPPSAGGFKKCTACPSGTYTARLGSGGPSQCKQPCQAGTFSLSGLEPCSQCPLHHYQPALGQQRCLQCSNETATSNEGQAAESACEAVVCSAKQCENKAECVVRDHRAVCECRPGFVGERCELNEPISLGPAVNLELMNVLAYLVPMVGTGFSGADCAEIEDICSSANPCHNGADCIPLKLGRFKCRCLPGWEGPTCEINIARRMECPEKMFNLHL
ncbi:GCC2 and GCC3 [Necator americanus]|uniref:GCC2 and GCC3 n=1 Tax=Necator americanus TaxID=51031 RepID=W2TBW8_NECAM|nr:GCC2 and GCC3 [Necator americanus]ETN78497.1 GCC2 and GCC3 [Necator americanus]